MAEGQRPGSQPILRYSRYVNEIPTLEGLQHCMSDSKDNSVLLSKGNFYNIDFLGIFVLKQSVGATVGRIKEICEYNFD